MSTISGSEEEPVPADGILVISGEEEPSTQQYDVDVEDIFRKRGFVSIPFCLRGPYRVVLRVALTESLVADPIRRGRSWKSFLLLPRMWICEQRN